MSGFTPLLTTTDQTGKAFEPLTSQAVQPLHTFHPCRNENNESNEPVEGHESSRLPASAPQSENQNEHSEPVDQSSSCVQSTSNELHVSENCETPPTVTLHKENGAVTGVRVVCGCGEVVDLTFNYQSDKTIDEKAESQEDRQVSSQEEISNESTPNSDAELLDDLDPVNEVSEV